jgi:beta-lactamase superfamily II metal-dependent hydrolase
VLQRLEAIGATVLRTDLDGQITIETDGNQITTQTFVGGNRGHGGLSH